VADSENAALHRRGQRWREVRPRLSPHLLTNTARVLKAAVLPRSVYERGRDLTSRRTNPRTGGRAGTLEWSCWTTAAHVAHDLLACVEQLAARPDDAYLPFDLVVRDDASPNDLLRIVTGCGRLLSNALAASEPVARAWHWGPTDPSGFAALGVTETLMHTYDITQGLGISWHPPESLCRAVLSGSSPTLRRVIRSRYCSGPQGVQTCPATLASLPGS
jgi:hypothetical protein